MVLPSPTPDRSMNFEQLTLGKGGVVGVCGMCTHEVKWGTLAADYLFGKMMSSKHYDQVTCINLDRKSADIANLAVKYDPSMKKLNIINRKQLLNKDGKLDWMLILDKCRTANHEMNPTVTYGVVIYSFSELILSLSWSEALLFLRQLIFVAGGGGGVGSVQKQAGAGTNKTGSAGTTVEQRPCIILVINESLHVPLVLTQIQRFLFTIAKILPNTGTLSNQVVCEIHTIRKSAITGRVAEGIDMFAYVQCGLQSIVISKGDNYYAKTGLLSSSTSNPAKNLDDFGDAEAPVAKTSTVLMQQEMSKHSELLSSASLEGKDVNNNSDDSEVPMNGVTMQRLITFENTDPEFDEDSDPDADLDL